LLPGRRRDTGDAEAEGAYQWEELRGWALPDRARHHAEQGEFFVGQIWSSVGKWCMTGGDCSGLIVSNGCQRWRLKQGMEDYRVDLLAGLSTEAYRTQMRALARGSDGLAEVTEDDSREVLLPRVTDPDARGELEELSREMLKGLSALEGRVSELVALGRISVPSLRKRRSRSVLVQPWQDRLTGASP
jgi:type I restriction enzyme M protein